MRDLNMYVPSAFELDEESAFDLIDELGFGLLISSTAGEAPALSHLPFLLNRSERCLFSHMARANPQWQALLAAPRVTIVFPGAHTYVSPRWYHNHPAVPTWNYEAVHVHGTCSVLDDPHDLAQRLVSLIDWFEGDGPDRWQPQEDEEYEAFATQLQRAIVGFEFQIERIEGKAKLSQNRPAVDREGIVTALEARGDAAAVRVAHRMRAVLGIET